MLPVFMGRTKLFAILAVLDIMMVGLSIFIGIRYSLSPVYLAGSGTFGLSIIVLSLYLAVRGRDKTAWLLFKLTSPYLAFIFVLITIEYAFIQ